MDPRIEKSADQAAARDYDHRAKGHRTVHCAPAESAMVQDSQWPKQAQQHVKAKPESDRPDRAGPRACAHPFAQRVAEQNQHHHAANDPQGIAKTMLGIDQAVVPMKPAKHDCGNHAHQHGAGYGPFHHVGAQSGPLRSGCRIAGDTGHDLRYFPVRTLRCGFCMAVLSDWFTIDCAKWLQFVLQRPRPVVVRAN